MSANDPVLVTERLRLRPWRDEDREPYARLNADPRVVEFLPSLLTREESDAMIDRFQAHFATHGFGLWAVEVIGEPDIIGFTGLSVTSFEAPFTPCVEVGWRLAADSWGKGYATEAARAAVAYAFDTLKLDQIVSFTVPDNQRSRRVMEKLGMRHDPAENFAHPRLPADHWLSQHVLYRLDRPGLEQAR